MLYLLLFQYELICITSNVSALLHELRQYTDNATFYSAMFAFLTMTAFSRTFILQLLEVFFALIRLCFYVKRNGPISVGNHQNGYKTVMFCWMQPKSLGLIEAHLQNCYSSSRDDVTPPFLSQIVDLFACSKLTQRALGSQVRWRLEHLHSNVQ